MWLRWLSGSRYTPLSLTTWAESLGPRVEGEQQQLLQVVHWPPYTWWCTLPPHNKNIFFFLKKRGIFFHKTMPSIGKNIVLVFSSVMRFLKSIHLSWRRLHQCAACGAWLVFKSTSKHLNRDGVGKTKWPSHLILEEEFYELIFPFHTEVWPCLVGKQGWVSKQNPSGKGWVRPPEAHRVGGSVHPTIPSRSLLLRNSTERPALVFWEFSI